MILSGTITLDPAAHAASTAAVRLRLEHLAERRRSAACSVEQVLATWRGEAAELFRTRWQEWDSGALAVIDQLTLAVDALDRARADVTGADATSAEDVGRLTGRLG